MADSLDILSASLLDFLPDSIAEDDEIRALSAALDPELQAVSAAIVEIIILPRLVDPAAVIAEDVLDALAWGFGLLQFESWDLATRERKQELLAQVVALYRRRGTTWAVRRALDLMGESYTLTRWHETTPDDPWTYRLQIIVSSSGLTADQISRARQLVDAYSNLTAYPAEVSALMTTSGSALLVTAPTAGIVVTVLPA